MAEVIAEVLGWVLGILSAAAGAGCLYTLRRLDAVRDEIRDHRILSAESYVHRGDWVREQTALEARLDRFESIVVDIRERVTRNEQRRNPDH